MKKTLLSIIFLFVVKSIFAQLEIINPNQYKNSKNFLVVDGDYQLNSNSIAVDFINKYYIGGYISNDIKNNTFKNLRENNTIGGFFNYKISYRFYPDTSLLKIGYFINVENHAFAESNFSGDFFKLIFNGNKQFAGKTANLSKTNFTYLNYQQLKIGIIKKFNNHHSLLVGAAFVKGQNFISLNLDNSNIFTEQTGEYLDFNINANIQLSDTSNMKIDAMNGFGATIDLGYVFQDKDNNFSVSLNNLGFINWNSKSTTLQKDTFFHFEGITVNDIFTLDSTTFSNINQDTILNKITEDSKIGSFSTKIPAAFQINYTKKIFKNKLFINGGIDYLLFSSYKPYFHIKPIYVIAKYLTVGLNLSYGGYGGMNAGIECTANINKNISVYLGSKFINGYILNKYSTGQGLFAALRLSL